jgi:hypothetical protein
MKSAKIRKAAIRAASARFLDANERYQIARAAMTVEWLLVLAASERLKLLTYEHYNAPCVLKAKRGARAAVKAK